MKTLTAFETAEILEIAKNIKASEKEQRELVELERVQKVIDLIDMIESIKPSESEALIKELKGLAKASDFSEFLILSIAGTYNAVKYDGLTVTVFKQNGEISVKSLPWRIYVDRYKMDFRNYFVKGVISSEIEVEGYSLTALECFKIWEDTQINKTKGSKDFDTNLGSIYKKKLEIKGLIGLNKECKRPYSKEAKKGKK